MADLSFRSASANRDLGGTATALNVGAPAGAAVDDLVVGFFVAGALSPAAAPTITLPSGWQPIREDTFTGGGVNWRVRHAYKIVAGGDSYTYTTGGTAFVAGQVCCYDNPDTANPFFTTTSRAAITGSATFGVTGITTPDANMLLVYAALGDQTGTFSRADGMTERTDVDSLTMADVIQAVAGATGTKTATLTAAANGQAVLMAFRSEPAVGGSTQPPRTMHQFRMRAA